MPWHEGAAKQRRATLANETLPLRPSLALLSLLHDGRFQSRSQPNRERPLVDEGPTAVATRPPVTACTARQESPTFTTQPPSAGRVPLEEGLRRPFLLALPALLPPLCPFIHSYSARFPFPPSRRVARLLDLTPANFCLSLTAWCRVSFSLLIISSLAAIFHLVARHRIVPRPSSKLKQYHATQHDREAKQQVEPASAGDTAGVGSPKRLFCASRWH